MGHKAHWEQIYQTKSVDQVSWYQTQPVVSLGFIRRTGIGKMAHIVDAGGGASSLVDYLLSDQFEHITVLDISATALVSAKTRIGQPADRVMWVEADITQCVFSENAFDLWHDRAVFHFLTSAEDRQKYIETVSHSLKPGGHIIIATFALDGPAQCSGLDVTRYSPNSLHHEFGDNFELVDSRHEDHLTPFDTRQSFVYCYWRKRPIA